MSLTEVQICELEKKLNPEAVTPAKPGYLEAFFAHVYFEPNSGCWLWGGADNGCGYGKFRGKYAHRISWETTNGAIPDGLHLDHLCRVRCCINPAHLEPVTNAENAKRGHCGHHMKSGGAPLGEDHPRSFLSDADIVHIRSLSAKGVTQKRIAELFKISAPTVSQIVRRVTWRHVE